MQVVCGDPRTWKTNFLAGDHTENENGQFKDRILKNLTSNKNRRRKNKYAWRGLAEAAKVLLIKIYIQRRNIF